MNNNKVSKRLSLINYDGINLFYKQKWTKIEFKTIDEGRRWLSFLVGLTDEQVEQWIKTYRKLK